DLLSRRARFPRRRRASPGRAVAVHGPHVARGTRARRPAARPVAGRGDRARDAAADRPGTCRRGGASKTRPRPRGMGMRGVRERRGYGRPAVPGVAGGGVRAGVLGRRVRRDRLVAGAPVQRVVRDAVRWARATPSTCFRTTSEKRADRGRVPPTSSSFLGRPRPIWTTRPSLATRAAYGLRRILDLEKSTSGISRSDAADGSRWLHVFAFFISPPFMPGRAPRADDADFLRMPLDEDGHQDALQN